MFRKASCLTDCSGEAQQPIHPPAALAFGRALSVATDAGGAVAPAAPKSPKEQEAQRGLGTVR